MSSMALVGGQQPGEGRMNEKTSVLCVLLCFINPIFGDSLQSRGLLVSTDLSSCHGGFGFWFVIPPHS